MAHGLRLVLLSLVAAMLAACSSSGNTRAMSAAAPSSSTLGSSTQHAASTTAPASGAGALEAEANSAATGDIPDNQVFLTFRSAAGWSMKYPEGWARKGSRETVTFSDKNNIGRVVVLSARPPTVASIRSELSSLPGVHVLSGPTALQMGGSTAFKVVYTTTSKPNPVTGKRVILQVDRYYLSHAGKEAVVDLGTPQGVDNVDAYRLMIESFGWR